MNEFGVDISGNNILDGNRLNAVDFALPRVGTLGYGSTGTPAYYTKPLSIKDNGFLPTVRNMQSAGKPVGTYLFSYAFDSRSAKHEAEEVCNYLDELGVSLELPVFFDWEYDSYNKVTAAGVRVTKQLVIAMTKVFMNVVKSRGRRAGFYSNLDYCNQYYDANAREAWRSEGFIFWLAQWTSAAAPALDCDVWQYAGDVPWMGWPQTDFNRVVNDNFFNGGTPGKLPVWLLLKLAEGGVDIGHSRIL